MAKLLQNPRIELHVNFTLNEAEVRALEALVGYGTDAFLKIFYEKLGRAYLQPHEAGLRSLFEGVREHLPAIMRRQDAARKAFCLQNPVVRSREDHEALLADVRANAAKGATP